MSAAVNPSLDTRESTQGTVYFYLPRRKTTIMQTVRYHGLRSTYKQCSKLFSIIFFWGCHSFKKRWEYYIARELMRFSNFQSKTRTLNKHLHSYLYWCIRLLDKQYLILQTRFQIEKQILCSPTFLYGSAVYFWSITINKLELNNKNINNYIMTLQYQWFILLMR